MGLSTDREVKKVEKLTRQTPPENIIRYVSTSEHYDLVQKLGTIEHQSERLIGQVCDHICSFRNEPDPDKFDRKCKDCPISELAELIGI